MRIISITTALAGGVFGVIETVQYRYAKDEFENIDNARKKNTSNENIIQEWDDAYENKKKHLAKMITGYGIAFLGIMVLTVSF